MWRRRLSLSAFPLFPLFTFGLRGFQSRIRTYVRRVYFLYYFFFFVEIYALECTDAVMESVLFLYSFRFFRGRQWIINSALGRCRDSGGDSSAACQEGKCFWFMVVYFDVFQTMVVGTCISTIEHAGEINAISAFVFV